MLTISEAAHLIDGIREYRIRQDVLHLLFNLGKCTGQLRSFKAGNKYLIAENDLYEVVFGTDSVSPHPCGVLVSPSVLRAPGKSPETENGGAA